MCSNRGTNDTEALVLCCEVCGQHYNGKFVPEEVATSSHVYSAPGLGCTVAELHQLNADLVQSVFTGKWEKAQEAVGSESSSVNSENSGTEENAQNSENQENDINGTSSLQESSSSN